MREHKGKPLLGHEFQIGDKLMFQGKLRTVTECYIGPLAIDHKYHFYVIMDGEKRGWSCKLHNLEPHEILPEDLFEI